MRNWDLEMKRELVFVLKEREMIGETVGRTRSGEVKFYHSFDCNGVGESKTAVKRRVNGKLLENSAIELPVPGDWSSVADPEINRLTEVECRDVRSELMIKSEAGKISYFSSNGASDRKQNGVSVVLGLAAKQFTRSSLLITDEMQCTDMKTLGEAGFGTLHVNEGEVQDEKHKQRPVSKEHDKSDGPLGIIDYRDCQT